MDRLQIQIEGVVQGVGFRPTVYRYAMEEDLTGYILNSGQGVTIEIQGKPGNLEVFLKKLKNSPPGASRIDMFNVTQMEVEDDEELFEIRFSRSGPDRKSAGISPDLATCPDCVSDIGEKGNRREGFAFANCTNCGPRFTIIRDRPYDRPYTSMADFKMCPACLGEYNDPTDRRFHAQPNGCSDCGPKLILKTSEPLSPLPQREIPGETVRLLSGGLIGAIKGLGGFHLACDPLDNAALDRLRRNKDRPAKAFALMMKDLAVISDYCIISNPEIEALSSPAAPIVLLRKRDDRLDSLSPDNNYLGVMLPFTPLHHLLMERIPLLVMTSANRRDEPLIIGDDEADAMLEEGFIDFYLTNDRPIAHRCDDSILQYSGGKMRFIRRSRGFVPNPVFIEPVDDQTVISLGADMKNTFSLRTGDRVYLSQHIGDLADFRNFEYQKEQIDDFTRLLDLEPGETRIDAHPSYENYRSGDVKVFHHHAHMLSVMAEHKLKDRPVLGVICDGTGYGEDGAIWGFEFLLIEKDGRTFERKAHLDYFPLPGGEAAIREIDRIAIALSDVSSILPFPAERVQAIRNLIESKLNCPPCSSLGRLFDGAAALTGLAAYAGYEARGAILLQREAEKLQTVPEERYPTEIRISGNGLVIGWKNLFGEISRDLAARKEIPLIAWKFHMWVADAILSVLGHLEPADIVLSGGCFQNSLLTEMITGHLYKNDLSFFMNEKVPPNDGGIALGQAYY